MKYIAIDGEIPQEAFDQIEDLLDSHGAQYKLVEHLPDPSKNFLGPSNDKQTSKSAANLAYPRSGSQRMMVLRAIAEAGDRGTTRDELFLKLLKTSKIRKSAMDARVWELGERNLRYVIPNGKTRLTTSGSSAEVLVLSEDGKAAMRKHGDA